MAWSPAPRSGGSQLAAKTLSTWSSGLSTNALTELGVGEGAATVLTTNKGRIFDLLLVLRRDGDLLVLTGVGNQGRVAEWVDFYTFVEDVSVEDVTGATAMLGVVGPGASAVVEAATGVADVWAGALRVPRRGHRWNGSSRRPQ